jgi:hypothetical protein
VGSLVVVALLASYLPVRAAAKIDPAVTFGTTSDCYSRISAIVIIHDDPVIPVVHANDPPHRAVVKAIQVDALPVVPSVWARRSKASFLFLALNRVFDACTLKLGLARSSSAPVTRSDNQAVGSRSNRDPRPLDP